MPAVVLDVGLGALAIGDLLLGARRNGLVDFQLGDARLVRAWNVMRSALRGMLVGHGSPSVGNIDSVGRFRPHATRIMLTP